jgi:hypothetical protein
LDLLNIVQHAGTGMGWGALCGAGYLVAAVASKQWLDRDLLPARTTAGRDLRREASAQRRALKNGQGHVPAGMPGAGQFTSVSKPDAAIGLSND